MRITQLVNKMNSSVRDALFETFPTNFILTGLIVMVAISGERPLVLAGIAGPASMVIVSLASLRSPRIRGRRNIMWGAGIVYCAAIMALGMIFGAEELYASGDV